MTDDKRAKPDTLLTHAGSHPDRNQGAVNPPVYRVSTVVFPTVAAMKDGEKHPFDHMRYGRQGTPTTFAFEEAVTALDGGFGALATCSGQAAIATRMPTMRPASMTSRNTMSRVASMIYSATTTP